MDAELASTRRELADTRQDVLSITQEIAELRALLVKQGITNQETTSASVGAMGQASAPRRSLSHSGPSHYVALQSYQVHEFAASGSCQPGTYTRLLPTSPDSTTPSYTSSLYDSSADLSLVRITDTTTSPWTTSTVQTMPAPLKVVHDADCASPPTLALQLDTSVNGSLSVNGHAVAAGPRAVQVVEATDTRTYPATSDLTAFPGLSQTINLDAESTVMVHYQVSFEDLSTAGGSFRYLTTVLYVDSNEKSETRSTSGITQGSTGNDGVTGMFSTTSGLWIGTLGAGSHQLEVRYRAGRDVTFTNDASNPQYTRNLKVLVL